MHYLTAWRSVQSNFIDFGRRFNSVSQFEKSVKNSQLLNFFTPDNIMSISVRSQILLDGTAFEYLHNYLNNNQTDSWVSWKKPAVITAPSPCRQFFIGTEISGSFKEHQKNFLTSLINTNTCWHNTNFLVSEVYAALQSIDSFEPDGDPEEDTRMYLSMIEKSIRCFKILHFILDLGENFAWNQKAFDKDCEKQDIDFSYNTGVIPHVAKKFLEAFQQIAGQKFMTDLLTDTGYARLWLQNTFPSLTDMVSTLLHDTADVTDYFKGVESNPRYWLATMFRHKNYKAKNGEVCFAEAILIASLPKINQLRAVAGLRPLSKPTSCIKKYPTLLTVKQLTNAIDGQAKSALQCAALLRNPTFARNVKTLARMIDENEM